MVQVTQQAEALSITGAHRSDERVSSGGLKTVPIDSQLPDFGIERLSGDTELSSGSSWTRDLAHGLAQRIFDHFFFALDQICYQRDVRVGGFWNDRRKPSLFHRESLALA